MTKKRKKGRPSLNHRFDRIVPGKPKFVKTLNIESCRQLARQYAKLHNMGCKTQVIDGRLRVTYTEQE